MKNSILQLLIILLSLIPAITLASADASSDSSKVDRMMDIETLYRVFDQSPVLSAMIEKEYQGRGAQIAQLANETLANGFTIQEFVKSYEIELMVHYNKVFFLTSTKTTNQTIKQHLKTYRYIYENHYSICQQVSTNHNTDQFFKNILETLPDDKYYQQLLLYRNIIFTYDARIQRDWYGQGQKLTNKILTHFNQQIDDAINNQQLDASVKQDYCILSIYLLRNIINGYSQSEQQLIYATLPEQFLAIFMKDADKK